MAGGSVVRCLVEGQSDATLEGPNDGRCCIVLVAMRVGYCEQYGVALMMVLL